MIATKGIPANLAVVIAAGQPLSGVVDLEGYHVGAIHMPAEWTAANLTLQAAPTKDGTFEDVKLNGVEVNIPVEQGKCEVVDEAAMAFAALRFIRFRSGTSAAPVNQEVERVLALILKG